MADCRNHVNRSSMASPFGRQALPCSLANRRVSARTGRGPGRPSGQPFAASPKPRLPTALPRVPDLAGWRLVLARCLVRAGSSLHRLGHRRGPRPRRPGPHVLPALADRGGAGGPDRPAAVDGRRRPGPGGRVPGVPADPTDSLVWLAFVLLAVMASFSAAFEPASAAAMPNLVEVEDLATANALSGSLWGTMLAVGAALGGVVAAVFGRDTAFILDAASFLASAWLIWRIRRAFAEERAAEDHAGVREATVETVRYARKDHRVLALLAVKFGWGIAGG